MTNFKGGRPLRVAQKGFDAVVDRLTKHINKLRALLAALVKLLRTVKAMVVLMAALVIVLLTQIGRIQRILVALHWRTPPACVQVETILIPDVLKYSEWNSNSRRIKLIGNNKCSTAAGVYMTFDPHVESNPRYRFGTLYEKEECKNSPLNEPTCWDRKRPIKQGKGDWEWYVDLPPLVPVGNPLPVDRIKFEWSVHAYDPPTNPELMCANATIELHNG